MRSIFGAKFIVTLGHISDLHGTAVRPGGIGPLLSKRALGWLSWRLRRRHRYRPAVLEALCGDLAESAPDQIAITGDLTNIGLEEEFREARDWLARIGPPERVHAIPGNHDAYVAIPHSRSWAFWSDYLYSDAQPGDVPEVASESSKGASLDFPSVRVRGRLALVGVCTAEPTLPFLASGSIGAEQLERLEARLVDLAAEGCCRVVLIHHPPEPGAVSRRRGLRDATAFGDVLRRSGAELVLHGHMHRTRVGSLPGPEGPIPSVGVRSASHAGPDPARCAAYHLYDIEPNDGSESGPRFRIRLRTRVYDPVRGHFVTRGPVDGAPLVG